MLHWSTFLSFFCPSEKNKTTTKKTDNKKGRASGSVLFCTGVEKRGDRLVTFDFLYFADVGQKAWFSLVGWRCEKEERRDEAGRRGG